VSDTRQPIRIFVAVEVRLYRDGLVEAIAGQEDMQVAGTWRAEPDAATLAAADPDVVLLSASAPERLVDIAELRRAAPRATVIVLAVRDAEPEVVAWAERGANGLVTVDASVDDLLAAVRASVRGEVICTPRTAAALLRRLAARAAHDPPATGAPAPRLTAREWEIVELVGDGLSNKEIAGRLQIELPTVKNHVHNVLGKLEVPRRFDVTARLRELRARQSLRLPDMDAHR
jgi:two-component system nitrate/nitrite response regulator NarL